jgi:hypothetical protein
MAVGTGTAIAIGAGASLLGGAMGAGAARDAAAGQAAAADRATALSREQFNIQREDQKPWMEAGGRALKQMEDPSFQKTFSMSDFNADPGYAFRMAEAEKAMGRSAAAKGQLLGGNFAKELTRYSQGAASEEYGKAYDRFNNDSTMRFNRLGALAGVGQTAVNQVGAAGQNYANQAGSNIIGAGNAAAAGQIGASNAMNQGIGQGMNTWMQYQMMQKNPWGGDKQGSGPLMAYGN